MTRSATRRRLITTIAPSLTLVLVAGACGSSGSSGSRSSGTSSAKKLAAASLNGSGSTFQQAFDEAVISQFEQAQPAVKITYAGGGSGKGLTDLQGGLVDFAGSDTAIKPEDLPKYKGKVLYFPTVAAPITLSYNLSGVSKLSLSAATIAKIFQGDIKTWSDPAIRADNPGVSLPGAQITVAHRADGSGTTASFTKYLTIAAPGTWRLGSDKTVPGLAGEGGNGNAGVAQIVKNTDGAIGYVDFSDARAAQLRFASIKNKAGRYVAPSLAGTSAALAKATVNADLTYAAFDEDGSDTYPVATGTWVLVYAHQGDAAKRAALAAFLRYALTEGQRIATQVDFAPLPTPLRERALSQLNQIVP